VAGGILDAFRGRRAPIVTAAVVALGWASAARVPTAAALGSLRYPSIEEVVTGARGILSEAFPLRRDGEVGPTVFAELSELRLYGLSGLHTGGARAGARLGDVTVVGAVSRLSSDIGGETVLSLAPAWHAGDRWCASAELAYESADINDLAAARLVRLTCRSRVRVTQRMSVGGEVGGLRLWGEPLDGADASVAMAARPVPGVTVRAIVTVDRWSGAQPSLSVTLAGGGALGVLRASFGYEGATDALKGALVVEVAGCAVSAGATYHPVLGARQGISVSWRR
jgi:hypothetical protein